MSMEANYTPQRLALRRRLAALAVATFAVTAAACGPAAQPAVPPPAPSPTSSGSGILSAEQAARTEALLRGQVVPSSPGAAASAAAASPTRSSGSALGANPGPTSTPSPLLKPAPVDVEGPPPGWERFELEGIIGARKPGWEHILIDNRIGVPQVFAGPGLARLDAEQTEFVRTFGSELRQRVLVFIVDPTPDQFTLVFLQPCAMAYSTPNVEAGYRQFIRNVGGPFGRPVEETTYTGLRTPLYLAEAGGPTLVEAAALNASCLLFVEHWSAHDNEDALEELGTFLSMLKAPPNP